MIAPGMVEEIKRLLAEGKLSQRKIAKVTGISRATIGAIASGKRPDYQPRNRDDEYFFRPTGPAVRCPGCGGKVYLPCQLCRVRAIKAEEEARRRALRRLHRRLRAPVAVLRADRRNGQSPAAFRSPGR